MDEKKEEICNENEGVSEVRIHENSLFDEKS